MPQITSDSSLAGAPCSLHILSRGQRWRRAGLCLALCFSLGAVFGSGVRVQRVNACVRLGDQGWGWLCWMLAPSLSYSCATAAVDFLSSIHSSQDPPWLFSLPLAQSKAKSFLCLEGLGLSLGCAVC